MRSDFNLQKNSANVSEQSKVKLTDLLSRINEEKKLSEIEISH